jgi:hypothetical protein
MLNRTCNSEHDPLISIGEASFLLELLGKQETNGIDVRTRYDSIKDYLRVENIYSGSWSRWGKH